MNKGPSYWLLHNQIHDIILRSFILLSCNCSRTAQKSFKARHTCSVIDLDHVCFDCASTKKRSFVRCTDCTNYSHSLSSKALRLRKQHFAFHRSRRIVSVPASADDRVTVSGSPPATSGSSVEAMKIRLDQSLQKESYNDGLVQSLHDAARVFELSFKEQRSLPKMACFFAALFGIDHKTLSYQASVYSLLQAANEISSHGDRQAGDVNITVQRCLLRLSTPLKSSIREKISAKQPALSEWFWSEQVPLVVSTFVSHFERDPRLKAVTWSGKANPQALGNHSDVPLVTLSLICIASITKLGPAKVSCSQLYSMIPDITGRLMDLLVDVIPIQEAYCLVKDIGLCKEFLVHFGPRAASSELIDSHKKDEVVFWVDLVQKQLQHAIDREKIWSRFTTSESIEVLERDLAVFGFFIALGRSTKTFLVANGFDNLDGPLDNFLRYLISGSVLYYPQLSSISSYQLYVEVVCEELDWLVFYPGYGNTIKLSHGHDSKSKGPPNAEAIHKILDVCSYWIENFIKHSRWVENPSHVKAAQFLSKGHEKLREAVEGLGILKNKSANIDALSSSQSAELKADFFAEEDSGSFDKAFESVDEALLRLENLLQDLHVGSSNFKKEHLKAACSDLERIRKLKKEAEFLEVSFKAKAASLQLVKSILSEMVFLAWKFSSVSSASHSCFILQFLFSYELTRQVTMNKLSSRIRITGTTVLFILQVILVIGTVIFILLSYGLYQYCAGYTRIKLPHRASGLWSFFVQPIVKKSEHGSSDNLQNMLKSTIQEKGIIEHDAISSSGESGMDKFQRFKALRSELAELEKRVQHSVDQPENEEEIMNYSEDVPSTELVTVQKTENILGKSFNKLKETTMDVWQGTQLLAIDVAAAMGLLQRVMRGDELTEKEKQILRRTLTDTASVVPIGILMLLPVTAVGHAAMLAAIQRYFPALIPSTYGSERLDLLRQLEKVKEMEPINPEADESLADK